MRQRQILVVDDEPIVRETVTLLLEAEGHQVTSADSGREALFLFRPGKFDLVFTDFNMPSMTGAQLAAAIKVQSPTQPVVIITAYPDQLRTALTEADLLIAKPFKLDTLHAAVTRFSPAAA